MKQKKLKSRKGVTLIESIAVCVLISLMLLVMVRFALVKTASSMAIDEQYSVITADGWMSDIYKDFHSCQSFEKQEMGSGEIQLHFMFANGVTNIYSYNPDTNKCYTNGVEQFDAYDFNIFGAGNNYEVSVKLSTGDLLAINFYI